MVDDFLFILHGPMKSSSFPLLMDSKWTVSRAQTELVSERLYSPRGQTVNSSLTARLGLASAVLVTLLGPSAVHTQSPLPLSLVAGRAQSPPPQGSTAKSVLVLSLRSATQAQRCSNATLSAEVFTDANSVQAYYAENSYGRASISGTVSGPYTIAMGDTCDQVGWASQANAAATAAGVNVGAYDEKIYVLPPESIAL